LEDCADVVKILYPQYDFLFLFDHSCGHDRMPDDALRVDRMNKGYGGEQNIMKESIIKSVHGYLGPHDHDRKLNVGDVPSMVFSPRDDATERGQRLVFLLVERCKLGNSIRIVANGTAGNRSTDRAKNASHFVHSDAALWSKDVGKFPLQSESSQPSNSNAGWNSASAS
jgi:hypothetical protein